MYKYIPSKEFKSGAAITDVLVVTKKGEKQGGLFKGIIIPTTVNEDVRNVIRAHQGQVGKAYHLNYGMDNMLTYVASDGYANCFGWYLLTEKVYHVKEFSLDICGPGWLKRQPVKNVEELKTLLKCG